MDSRVNFALVGAFVLILGGAAIALLLWLAGGGPKPAYDHYLIYTTDSVAGLNTGAPVLYHGVRVGRVGAIELEPNDPQKVRILLDIKKGTPIRADVQATLKSQGITGGSYIGLSGGSPKAPPLTANAGQPYPVIPFKPSLFAQLGDIATQTGTSLEVASQRINEVLSPENIRRLNLTLAHLETLSGALAADSGRINDALRQLDATLKQLHRSSLLLPPILDSLNQGLKPLPQTIANFNHSTEVFNLAADNVSAAAIGIQKTVPQLDRTLRQLDATAATYRRLGEELQRHPNALLFGAPPPRPGPGE